MKVYVLELKAETGQTDRRADRPAQSITRSPRERVAYKKQLHYLFGRISWLHTDIG